jgi:hypothetical protein
MATSTLAPARKPDWRLALVSGLLLLAWNVVSWRFPFFWDTVLNSKIAHWYLETGFSQLTVPENLDAGHPPFFSMYIAVVWQLFGRSLAMAHLAMLPLLGILLWQFHRLAARWLSLRGCLWATLLLFCEPTLLAQASMVTPDIALVAFYLLALNALLDGRRLLAAIAMVLLASMSFRGILMVPALFVTEVLTAWFAGSRKPDWQKIWPYLPVAGLTLLWLWLHHRAVGWLLSPPAETYGGQRQLVGIVAMLRNAAVIGWRMLDFGRVFLWGMAAIGILALGLRRTWAEAALRGPLIALLAPTLLLTSLFVPFSNPVGHRYFLVAYVLLILLVVGLVELGEWQKWGRLALAAVMLGLATGHFWIYPRGVAQGWDGSLAHLPSFGLQKEMDGYLSAQGISPADVCGDFPCLGNPYFSQVLPLNAGEAHRNFLESADCHWALVSRLNNGYTLPQLQAFESSGKWVLRKGLALGPMYLRLYEHR